MAKRKIMVVDDDEDLLRLMGLTLQVAGYDVVTASNGAEALTKVRTERPDLILLDVMMPEMDGFETCRRLRRLPEGADIPVIMLSAADQVSDKVKGLQVGANDYITKPVDSRELLARIEAHLRPIYARPARIIALLGSKSGVGVTVLAVNLAIAVKQMVEEEVALLDWHLPMGDVAIALNLTPRHTLDDLASKIDDLDAQMLEQVIVRHPSGLQVISGGRALDTTALTPVALESVLDILSRTAAYIIIDAGARTEPEWLEPLGIVDELLLVVTPELPALRRAAVCLEWERQHTLFGDRLYLIINRAGIKGGIPPREVEELLGLQARARFPDDVESVMLSLNQGVSLVENAARSALTRAIKRLAQEIVQVPEQEAGH
ncbi:MAG TPA: response regulator [Caldilineae bacterium]|nr:response regulator [Caldilineae bacterium]